MFLTGDIWKEGKLSYRALILGLILGIRNLQGRNKEDGVGIELMNVERHAILVQLPSRTALPGPDYRRVGLVLDQQSEFQKVYVVFTVQIELVFYI